MAAGAAPAGELRILAPSAPGSASDQLAQALKMALSDERGESPVQVTNVPGAGGTVGLAQFLAERREDALLVTGLTMVDAAFIHRAPVAVDQLTPIARLSAEPFTIVVPVASPLRSLDDLRSTLAGDPSRIAWAGGPVGGIEHVATILLTGALGLEAGRINYVPFLTVADAAASLGDGQMSVAVLPAGDISAELKAGRLRILAVSSAARAEAIDAPSLFELGIPFELSNWRGLLARPGLGQNERERLAGKIARLAASRAWQEMLERRGWREAYLGPEAFGAFIRREQARVKDALKAGGLLKRRLD
jgi:putative tricarboxylic transport membrane protein